VIKHVDKMLNEPRLLDSGRQTKVILLGGGKSEDIINGSVRSKNSPLTDLAVIRWNHDISTKINVT
jgi:hypothetical protein